MAETLNARQRFSRIMRFESVDRAPLWSVEEVFESTVRRWVREGVFPLGMDLRDVFKLDPREIVALDTDPLPNFVSRKLEDDETWRITTDKYGFTVKTLKEQSVGPTIYYYVDGTVNDRRDWEALKKRYDPTDPRRRPRAWGPELIDYYNNATFPVGLRIDWGPGRGIKNGFAMGLENFLVTLIDDPGLVKDMNDFWADFVIEVARDVVSQCKIDFAYFTEDGIGYKNASIVSPEMYGELWIPAMRKVTDFLHGHGVNVIAHYSSGCQIPLMPVLLDIGVNCYFPLEVAAGVDARELRRRFGKDILLIGNISRQALMDGPEAVEKEFYAKVPPLMKEGGYIAAVDDAIMPDISFESYKRYLDLAREFRL